MKKAPSTFTAIALLAVFLFLGNGNLGLACSECICFIDETCSNQGCTENLTTNCKRTEFTPECDQAYTLTVGTICTGDSDCEDCRACANLFKLDNGVETWLSNCHTHECDIGNCTTNCGQSQTLSSSDTYVIYICKVPCPGGPDCEDCASDCIAYACLSYGALSCTP